MPFSYLLGHSLLIPVTAGWEFSTKLFFDGKYSICKTENFHGKILTFADIFQFSVSVIFRLGQPGLGQSELKQFWFAQSNRNVLVWVSSALTWISLRCCGASWELWFVCLKSPSSSIGQGPQQNYIFHAALSSPLWLNSIREGPWPWCIRCDVVQLGSLDYKGEWGHQTLCTTPAKHCGSSGKRRVKETKWNILIWLIKT